MPVALDEVDECAGILDWSWRQNAVAEIHNVARRTGLLEYAAGRAQQSFRGAEKQTWIEIALNRQFVTDYLSRFSYGQTPIDA